MTSSNVEKVMEGHRVNEERSHAGPTAPDCNRDVLPALAGAFGSAIYS